jgi:hypothetical protein
VNEVRWTCGGLTGEAATRSEKWRELLVRSAMRPFDNPSRFIGRVRHALPFCSSPRLQVLHTQVYDCLPVLLPRLPYAALLGRILDDIGILGKSSMERRSWWLSCGLASFDAARSSSGGVS